MFACISKCLILNYVFYKKLCNSCYLVVVELITLYFFYFNLSFFYYYYIFGSIYIFIDCLSVSFSGDYGLRLHV